MGVIMRGVSSLLGLDSSVMWGGNGSSKSDVWYVMCSYKALEKYMLLDAICLAPA